MRILPWNFEIYEFTPDSSLKLSKLIRSKQVSKHYLFCVARFLNFRCKNAFLGWSMSLYVKKWIFITNTGLLPLKTHSEIQNWNWRPESSPALNCVLLYYSLFSFAGKDLHALISGAPPDAFSQETRQQARRYVLGCTGADFFFRKRPAVAGAGRCRPRGSHWKLNQFKLIWFSNY